MSAVQNGAATNPVTFVVARFSTVLTGAKTLPICPAVPGACTQLPYPAPPHPKSLCIRIIREIRGKNSPPPYPAPVPSAAVPSAAVLSAAVLSAAVLSASPFPYQRHLHRCNQHAVPSASASLFPLSIRSIREIRGGNSAAPTFAFPRMMLD